MSEAPTNIPVEPAAVPSPIIKLRDLSLTDFPKATITEGKEHVPVPMPTMIPERTKIISSMIIPRIVNPLAAIEDPKASTRTGPYLSATKPANGCVTPHTRARDASDSEKISRAQPKSSDIGRRNIPNEAGKPEIIKAIKQPAITACIFSE